MLSEDFVTRVSVHQPNFLPWTKLFDKVLGSDVYIEYDSVQYTRSEFHSRRRRSPAGTARCGCRCLS